MAGQVLEFPDAVEAWVGYLAPRLDPPVGGERRDADAFVRVLRTGGVRQTKITDNAQVTFECYARYDDDAARLASHARSHVLAAAGSRLSPAAFCKSITEVSGPAEMPDPDTELSRYSFTVLTALKATVAAPEQLRGTPAA
ncbi:tail terminator [Arthrobacter phage Shambre1]|uniref:Tail terminator n=1 Tax=Arthrobacter phage Shambre1 TaxID=2927284 RepID=A0A977KNI8_9CAUD|nr:tail terminator [Arthrobacter phage Shambre1]UXE04749.1 tail terminator [Arthrobacter phage Shambre1]